jgi:glycogen debranching enzyme
VNHAAWLVRVNARPDSIYISHGRSVLAARRDGTIDAGRGHGLFVHETRLLSRLRYLIDGEAPEANVLSNVEQHSWLGYFIRVAPGVDPGPVDRGSGQVPAASRNPVELRVSRFAGEGLHEDLDLTNFARGATRFALAIELDADFADLAETGGTREQLGTIERSWLDERTLRFAYTVGDSFARAVTIAFSRPPVKRDPVTFDVALAPHESWHLCIDVSPTIDGTTTTPVHRCRDFRRGDNPLDRRVLAFTITDVVLGTLQQATYDLAALRLFDLDTSDRAWTMAAGLPMYVALYGRDALTAPWQAAMLDPRLMEGVLHVLARNQGTQVDDWRDEQPGRMLHEMHTGPLSALDLNPRARSYGSTTTSGLYPFIVAELWHWTGDRELVEPFLDPALRALEWLDRDGRRDRDGFYGYKTRSRDGVRNQGWKDSDDAIVDTSGRLVDPPIATCEEQGFVYIAKLHLSETLWWLGRKREARRLFREARELKKRFNAAFWNEEDGFFVLGLDANQRQVRSIASNAGHCIATAICDADKVRRVADRLFEPDLFSGWGIRTLSDRHPAYNPYSYHLGSIWPVEHGTFALGFMRYGLHERAQQLARAQFEAAALFDFYRLPELFSGHARDDDHPFPAVYPNANTPQAWSASTTFCLLQSMLGLYPYAPLHMLLVDPHLPDWLPEITLRDLRVGEATVTIRFRRRRDGSSTYTVLRKRGKLHVVRQATPWSLTTSFAERLRDSLVSLLPGK